jgi:hypothetical protein
MLINETSFEAERTWVRDKEGVHHWIVVVKATYDIAPDGSLTLASKPVEPLHAPLHYGDPSATAIRYEADMIAMKPATDVYLNGIAHAPGGQACTEVTVSMRLGRLRKELLVRGERRWESGLIAALSPSSPLPFETMPITWDRAFGGFDDANPDPKKQRIDFRNPIGSGIVVSKALIGKLAPSIEYPDRKPGDGWPAGFGAVSSWWSPRREWLGTYDEQWMAKRRPLLPHDYDPRALLCAPPDQQPGHYLRGGEPVELVNLTPGGRLQFVLPQVQLGFASYFGKARREHTSELVTVIIDSAEPRLIQVWQSSLRCGNDADYLDHTVIQSLGPET